ncbi:MAG TPA: tetratricopeptide repeat protein [Candidatus Angelobacter sp.]
MFRRLTLSALVLAIAATALALPLAQRGAGNRKVIKDPVEYNAYMTAVNMRDAAQKGAALEAFVRNYPDSVVKIDALEHAMAAYQQNGNTAKVEDIAKHILALHPYNVRALAVVTYIQRSGNEFQPETCTNAQKGLQALGSWEGPEGISEPEFHKLRAQTAQIFYGALGSCALQKKDYATARDDYQKALQINPGDMVNTYQLAVADLETDPVDPIGFWYIAKAMNLAQTQGNPQASQGMETYGKEKYRKYHGSDDGWDAIVKEASSESTPPADFNKNSRIEPSPAQLAVAVVEQSDPATLSFSDWELVLKYRDASPQNTDAAEKVWQAIQAKQAGGASRMKLSIKVVSATKDMIYGAITEESRNANQPDVRIFIPTQMSHPPAVGATVDVIGVMAAYTPQPFLFIMGKGELVSPKPAVSTQLSVADVEKLLQGGVTPKRTTELVKQKGVDFALDNSTEVRLRKAGATDELLLAIATSKKP